MPVRPNKPLRGIVSAYGRNRREAFSRSKIPAQVECRPVGEALVRHVQGLRVVIGGRAGDRFWPEADAPAPGNATKSARARS